jgi:hypothetical protein
MQYRVHAVLYRYGQQLQQLYAVWLISDAVWLILVH